MKQLQLAIQCTVWPPVTPLSLSLTPSTPFVVSTFLLFGIEIWSRLILYQLSCPVTFISHFSEDPSNKNNFKNFNCIFEHYTGFSNTKKNKEIKMNHLFQHLLSSILNSLLTSGQYLTSKRGWQKLKNIEVEIPVKILHNFHVQWVPNSLEGLSLDVLWVACVNKQVEKDVYRPSHCSTWPS